MFVGVAERKPYRMLRNRDQLPSLGSIVFCNLIVFVYVFVAVPNAKVELPNRAEYELLCQSWDTINLAKYRNLRWGRSKRKHFRR